MSTDASVAHHIGTAVAEPVVFPAIEPLGETEGYTRGHAAGYAAGLRLAQAEAAARESRREAEHAAALGAGRARADRAVQLLKAAARALEARTAPVLAEADAQLAAAALALAEAVVGRHLSDAYGAARAALERALSGPEQAGVISVRLHPDDLALLGQDAAPPTVDLQPDATLARGDAVAVYPDGELDARIDASLARARAALDGGTP